MEVGVRTARLVSAFFEMGGVAPQTPLVACCYWRGR
jgi:hypothetical protein